MGHIRILEDQLVNQIAAGEVVERPASVVKELVENSIDASAKNIQVSLEAGGRVAIEVRDDGSGMSKDDLLLAVRRFGTSKISCAEDLWKIDSFGFRGEALPSIASVSEFKISTRDRISQTELGYELSIDSGEQRSVVPCDREFGTAVSVRNLFSKLPARRRFLRTERSETSACKQVVVDLALANPKLRFLLSVDGRELVRTVAEEEFFERARSLLKLSNRAFHIQHRDGDTEIVAALSEPGGATRSAQKLRLFVNKRAVRDKLLLAAVRDAYGTMLKGGEYPSGVLMLNLPANEVDVNVHPQKTEVRFREKDHVFRLVRATVKHFLEQVSAPRAQAPKSRPKTSPEVVWHSPGEGREETFIPIGTQGPSGCAKEYNQRRFVGQVLGCYLVFESSKDLLIVDSHAAHERVTFHRLKEQYMAGNVASQQLLVPVPLELDDAEAEAFETLRPMAEQLGFRFTPNASNLSIEAVPGLLTNVAPQILARELVTVAEGEDAAGAVERLVDAAIARLACHGSVRSGRILRAEEAFALLDQMDEADSSGLCPHGRPVAQIIKEADVESFFERRH